MSYCLKSGLGKRKVHTLCKEFVGDRISLPSAYDCHLHRNKNNYWLSFFGYELAFGHFFGGVQVRVTCVDWPEDSCGPCHKYLFSKSIPFDYLKNHDFLREVA